MWIWYNSMYKITFPLYFRLLPGEGALCSIPIENILAVERLEEESFRMKNVSLRKLMTSNSLPSVHIYTHESRDCSLTPVFSPPPDVPGHSTGASALHPGQQLCGGPRLDWHPDQSQPVQPQTIKHLPSVSLPQRPLALLQDVCRHSTRVHALHWVGELLDRHPASHALPCVCSHSCFNICFQRSTSKHSAGHRRRQRDWEDLFPLQHIHDQTDQDARSDTSPRAFSTRACTILWRQCLHISLHSLFSTAEACGSKSVYDGPEQEEYSSFVIDDPQETYKTLKLIVSAVQTLEQQHTKYKRDKFKKTKIGSQ